MHGKVGHVTHTALWSHRLFVYLRMAHQYLTIMLEMALYQNF